MSKKQNSKLVFFSKCQTTVYRKNLPVSGTFVEVSYLAHIEDTTKRRGGLPILSRYTSFWQKYDVCIFKIAKNGTPEYYCIPLISQPCYGTSASLRYIQRQQNQEGDTDIPFTVTVYRFMAKNTSRFFILPWF